MDCLSRSELCRDFSGSNHWRAQLSTCHMHELQHLAPGRNLQRPRMIPEAKHSGTRLVPLACADVRHVKRPRLDVASHLYFDDSYLHFEVSRRVRWRSECHVPASTCRPRPAARPASCHVRCNRRDNRARNRSSVPRTPRVSTRCCPGLPCASRSIRCNMRALPTTSLSDSNHSRKLVVSSTCPGEV